jgi:hypothetical protein
MACAVDGAMILCWVTYHKVALQDTPRGCQSASEASASGNAIAETRRPQPRSRPAKLGNLAPDRHNAASGGVQGQHPGEPAPATTPPDPARNPHP